MAYEEYIQKAIQTGKTYHDLPERVRAVLPLGEWRIKVKEFCIQRGMPWDSSMARGVCNEQEYYEDLIKAYKQWARLYPYHLSDYVARVLRVTPFKYYTDVLFLTLKDEKSYDRIPNFTAADVLRVTGVGRNEYISIMNACKAKKLLWRVNKGLARDLLPPAPLDLRLEPWWRVQVVNVGDAEFRELSPPEAGLLRQACEPPGANSSAAAAVPPVSAFDAGLVQSLYKRGIIYLDVPVVPDDRISLPPLEGFVSNKTSEAGDESVDPFEPLLYSLFLANSSRLDQARLADILAVELQQLLLATSLAIRLGFATRLGPGSSGAEEGGAALPPIRGLPTGTRGVSQVLSIPDSDDEAAAGASPTAGAAAGAAAAGAWAGAAAGDAGGGGGGGEGGAVAVVVDAEATSYLMMGALSPGLKRHSVTLFEGGRVGGAAVIDELIDELAASAAEGAYFEGDMVQLMRHIQSLGTLLAMVRQAAAAQGHTLELLRKESLAGLDPVSAAKVLCHAYTSIIPIAPMPSPALPLSPLAAASPTLYGPTPEADSPWLQMALYAAARAGPVSLVFVAGARVWRLPGQLEGCTHALLWGWKAAEGWAAGPLLVEGTSLLCTLNELLCRTAVMVQPLVHIQHLPSTRAGDSPLVAFIDVPLPLCQVEQQQPAAGMSAAAGLSSAAGVSAAAYTTSPTAPAAAAVAGVDADDGSGQVLRSSSSGVGRDVADAAGTGEVLLAEVPDANRSRSSVAAAAAAAGSSPTAAVGISRSSSAAVSQQQQVRQQQQQQQQQQQHDINVLAVDRQQGDKLRQLVVPGHVVAALDQLQLRSAVGWLRLVKLPGPNSSGWVPLSLNLGVPLFCPTLCQQVCANMAAAQCLSPAGRSAWRASQLQLQQQLWQLVAQYGAVGSSYGGHSSSSSSSRAKLSAGGSGSGVDAGLSSGGVGSGSAASAGPGGMQLDVPGLGVSPVSGDVELPACCLLFDGCGLLPVDVGDCLQGVRLW